MSYVSTDCQQMVTLSADGLEPAAASQAPTAHILLFFGRSACAWSKVPYEVHMSNNAMHQDPGSNPNESPHDNRMPLTRLVLYLCFVLLALLALLQFDLKLIIPIFAVLSVQIRFERMTTPFGYKRPRAPASQPRDIGDPVVRAYLVVGSVLLIAGLAIFLWFPIAAAPGPLMSILPKWFVIPGVQAILLGAVLTALGFDLLKGGLWRPWGEPQNLDSQDSIVAEKSGLFRYVAPWLALAWVADLGSWPNLAQAIVGLMGLGLLGHLAKDWPLFAAVAAPAVAFYSWSAAGHAKSAFGPANPLVFLILIVALVAGIGLVTYTLGRAVTGALDTIKRRTWKREPWFRQAVQGVAACVLASTAHTQLKERREQLAVAEVAARHAAWEAASRADAAEKAEVQSTADAMRAKAEALVPGISCSYSPVNGFMFQNQHKSPEPGVPGRVYHALIGNHSARQDPREAQVLDASVDLNAFRQHASNAPILHLPSGDVVFISPTGDRILMLDANGLVLQLARLPEPHLKYPPVACASENGTRWAVALGPAVKVFEWRASDVLPLEVNQGHLNSAWFP